MRAKVTGIYRIRCTASGKAYVGSSVDVFDRFVGHRRSLVNGNHCNPKLQNAWNKYGPEAFVFQLLEVCPRNRFILIVREQFWIDALGAFTDGLNGRPTANNMAGIKWSVETNRKRGAAISKAMTGRKYTPEEKASRRLSQVVPWNKGLRGDPRCISGNLGRHLSEEERQKTSDATRKAWADGKYDGKCKTPRAVKKRRSIKIYRQMSDAVRQAWADGWKRPQHNHKKSNVQLEVRQVMGRV